ncbi:IclR family transcriptional regulator [Arthrobacter antibioticus]|uniref:IclR family transcriptional regulator n=1 Tax=Arthrobacter sp. H35-MC1 TaxID=3046203 RepID=UPI0024BB0B6A|nr:IclR family transcriptional regulator [Arthrobacter sp. H35-MC1]MDJ0318231.1 IclR family transcriptional regulator [Arthrobacter sp. H35-MC1]
MNAIELVGEKRNSSSSLRKALLILSVVAEQPSDPEGLALSDLAEITELNKSTVLRLTAPLIDEHLIERDRVTGKFRLGFGSLRLGQSYLDSLDLRSAANEELRALMRKTANTVHLVVLSGHDVVYLDKVEDEATVRMASRVGATMPAYCTAVGKAIMAYSPEEVVSSILSVPLAPITSKTITNPGELRMELGAVKRRGYSIDDRENEPEVRCVAAPIFNHDDVVVAALSVSSLTSRMTPAKVREVGPMAADVGLRISVKLGSRRAAAQLAK